VCIKFDGSYIKNDISNIKNDENLFNNSYIIYMENAIEQMVFTAAVFRKTNVAEIARAIGMQPSNLYRKLRCNTLKPAELIKIGKILGAEYVYYFSFPNGTQIGKQEKRRSKMIKTA